MIAGSIRGLELPVVLQDTVAQTHRLSLTDCPYFI